MVTKAGKSGRTGETPQDDAMKGMAGQAWQAGLGAFARVQEEGGKVFETLVREGSQIQRRTQAAAEEKMAEAAERMAAMAGDISSRAQGQWGKLEGIFEDRVAQALQRLGMPTAAEVQALQARVAALERQLAAAQAPARATAKKAPARRAAPRKSPPRAGD